MKKVLFQTLLGVSLLLGGNLSLACDYPPRPHIPDGKTATKEDMEAAKTAVLDFLSAVDDYVHCVEAEEVAAVTAIPEEERSQEDLQNRELELNRKFDAANEERELVGEQFNKQVRAFNARQAEEQE